MATAIDIEDEYARFTAMNENDNDLTKILNESQEYQRKFLTSSSKQSLISNDWSGLVRYYSHILYLYALVAYSKI